MKKLIFAVVLLIGFSSFAQENQSDKKPKKAKREQMSPEQRSQVALDKMTTELSLNSQQQEQIKPILVEQRVQQQELKEQRMASNAKEWTSQERDAARQKNQQDRMAMENKLKAILTPDQFKKMKDNQAANREKMKEARESRQNNQKIEE